MWLDSFGELFSDSAIFCSTIFFLFSAKFKTPLDEHGVFGGRREGDRDVAIEDGVASRGLGPVALLPPREGEVRQAVLGENRMTENPTYNREGRSGDVTGRPNASDLKEIRGKVLGLLERLKLKLPG